MKLYPHVMTVRVDPLSPIVSATKYIGIPIPQSDNDVFVSSFGFGVACLLFGGAEIAGDNVLSKLLEAIKPMVIDKASAITRGRIIVTMLMTTYILSMLPDGWMKTSMSDQGREKIGKRIKDGLEEVFSSVNVLENLRLLDDEAAGINRISAAGRGLEEGVVQSIPRIDDLMDLGTELAEVLSIGERATRGVIDAAWGVLQRRYTMTRSITEASPFYLACITEEGMIGDLYTMRLVDSGLPGVTRGKPKFGHGPFVAVVDESGSMEIKDVAQIKGLMRVLALATEAESYKIIGFSSGITGVITEKSTLRELVEFMSTYSGGGTVLNKVADFIIKGDDIPPGGDLIILSDGHVELKMAYVRPLRERFGQIIFVRYGSLPVAGSMMDLATITVTASSPSETVDRIVTALGEHRLEDDNMSCRSKMF